MSFEADWLAARAPYDEAALDRHAIARLVAWGVALPAGYAPVVVDLGTGTGAALRRAARWLAPRRLVAYAVDQDATLLARAAADQPFAVQPVLSDLLQPLDRAGGPPDGTVDLVTGHALADLLPLDRLAARVAALVRPGGLVHLALAYDGLTRLGLDAAGDGGSTPSPVPPDLDAALMDAFHRHMDRRSRDVPTYGGSTSGRRLGLALGAAGLDVLADAPSVWDVHVRDGEAGRRVLARLVRYVADAARDLGDVPVGDIAAWEGAQQAALATGTLAARVGHRDVLARRL